MMKLYLAGKMRGLPLLGASIFRDATQQLRGVGYEIVSPIEMDEADGIDFTSLDTIGATVQRTADGAIDEEYYLQRDERVIAECDGIALLDNWTESTGAQREVRCAIALDKPTRLVARWLTMAVLNAEVRMTDATTGAQKGGKLARYDLIPTAAMREIAEVFGRGAQKYAERNWEKGYAWGWSYAALHRHLAAFWSGCDRDAESGQPHMAHAAWHCLVLLTFMLRGAGTDDRVHEARP